MLMKIKTAINIARVILVSSFLVTLYFLLPYVASIIGVNSFVVVSESMRHTPGNQGFLESFWENMSVRPESVPFRYGFGSGDLLFVAPEETYNTGDVVVFQKPGSTGFFSHRIYKLNSTHFRDIGDNYMGENDTENTTLAVVGVDVFDNSVVENMFIRPDFTYQGPRLERQSHYWMPVSYIRGRVFFILPGAGLLRNFLEKPVPES
jgi:hypothetical protein